MCIYVCIGIAAQDVDTPMRMGPGRVPGRASDNISLPPTSPANISLPATSPARGLGGMSEIDLSSPLNYGTPSSMGSIRTPRSGIRGTPLRARPDIRTDKRIRQVAIGGTSGVRIFIYCKFTSRICYIPYFFSWNP